MGDILKNLTATQIGLLLSGLLASAVLLYLSDSTFRCGYKDGVVACGFDKGLTLKEKRKFFGYFFTFDDQNKVTCLTEELEMSFYGDDETIGATARGKAHDNDGNLVDRSWKFSGFVEGNNLALSYITDDKPNSGVGAYFLVSKGGDYHGYWLGVDYPSGQNVRCPYVLTPNKSAEGRTCEARFPTAFKNKTCEVIQ